LYTVALMRQAGTLTDEILGLWDSKLRTMSKQSSSSPTSGSSMQMEGAQFEKLSLNTTSTASTV
jgi:hypothetical protein